MKSKTKNAEIFFSRFLLCLIVMAGLVSCSKDGDDSENSKSLVPEISVPAGNVNYFGASMEFDAPATEKEVVFSSNVPWSAQVTQTNNSGSVEWCRLSPNNGIAGTSTMKIKVDENTNEATRSAQVVIIAGNIKQTITIIQEGRVLSMKTQQYDISSAEQDVVIEIQSNFNFGVKMPDVTWLKQVSTRAVETRVLTLHASQNDTYDTRSAVVEVYDVNGAKREFITINQAQKNTLEIDNDSFSFDGSGGTFSVAVRHNVPYDVSIDCNWISEMSSRAISTDLHSFMVATTNSSQERVGTITFYNHDTGLSCKVTVKQRCTFYLEESSVNIVQGEEKKLTLINNTGQKATWKSDNSSVATVDNSGRVKGVSKGNATITVMTSDGKYWGKCEVFVKDITDFIYANSTGGAIMQLNDLIQYGSKLNWSFTNGSSVDVVLKSMQLIDGVTKQESNIMSVGATVNAGNSVYYTTSVGLAGIHIPVTCRFRYELNGKEYSVDAVYEGTHF